MHTTPFRGGTYGQVRRLLPGFFPCYTWQRSLAKQGGKAASVSQSRVNRRESFRCPVASRRMAELVAGDSRVPVVVENESATGFGVTTDQPLRVHQGDVVQLQTDAGSFEVRVARIAVAEAAATESGPKRAGGKTLRLGLERIRDLTAITYQGWRSIRWRDIFFPPWIYPPRTPTVIVGVLLLLLVGIVPVATILYLRGPDKWISPRAILRETAAWLGLADADRSSQSSDSTGPDSQSRLASGRPQNGGAGPLPLFIPETLYPTVDRLLGSAAQTAPQALRKLDLTAGQQRRLQQLLEQVAEAFGLLDSQRAKLSRDDRARIERELVEAARWQTFDLLTVEQQKAWQALFPDPPVAEEEAPPAPPGGKPDGSTL